MPEPSEPDQELQQIRSNQRMVFSLLFFPFQSSKFTRVCDTEQTGQSQRR